MLQSQGEGEHFMNQKWRPLIIICHSYIIQQNLSFCFSKLVLYSHILYNLLLWKTHNQLKIYFFVLFFLHQSNGTSENPNWVNLVGADWVCNIKWDHMELYTQLRCVHTESLSNLYGTILKTGGKNLHEYVSPSLQNKKSLIGHYYTSWSHLYIQKLKPSPAPSRGRK